MSTVVSFSQQSPLSDNAYLSLTSAIRGSTDAPGSDDRSGALSVTQAGTFVRLGQSGAERDH